MVRKEECEFSDYSVHPGHGIRYVPFAFISTKPVLTFARPKCVVQYTRKKNPRFVPWTRTYRRLCKKFIETTTTRRRATRRTANAVPRPIVGADLAYIQEERAKRPVKVDRSAKARAVRDEIAARKAKK